MGSHVACLLNSEPVHTTKKREVRLKPVRRTARITEGPLHEAEEGEISVDLEALSAESAATTFTPKTDISDLVAAAGKEQDRRAPRQAKWLPMLLAPEALDGTMAGDVGFDPLGFASDKAALIKMRDAGM